MGYAFSLQELASDLGTATADGARNIANTAANFACDLYSQYANATANFPDPTGIGAFNNALYSRLCSPRKLTPPGGNDSWTGGQCEVLYDVTIEETTNDVKTNRTYAKVPGPIHGVIKTVVGSSYKYYIVAPNFVGPPAGRYEVGSIGTGDANNKKYNRRIVNVVTSNGQPDTCGNYPYPYPNVSIENNNSLTKNNTTINIGGGAVITGNLVFSPVVIEANAFINPQINVKVGPFDVTFDLGGVQISPNFNLTQNTQSPSPTQLPPSSPPPVQRNKDNDPCSTTIPPCDLTPVITKLDNLQTTANDIQDCSCPVDYQVSVVSIGSGQGSEVPLPSNTTHVRLQLTQIPLTAKTQKGSGSAPTQYFCGYYSFGDGVGLGERIPINTQSSTFEVPVWASSFCWNLYLGYEASVSAVTLIPSKPNAEFATRQLKLKPA